MCYQITVSTMSKKKLLGPQRATSAGYIVFSWSEAGLTPQGGNLYTLIRGTVILRPSNLTHGQSKRETGLFFSFSSENAKVSNYIIHPIGPFGWPYIQHHYGLCHPKFTHAYSWVFSSLKYYVLKSLQVGVGTNPPVWF